MTSRPKTLHLIDGSGYIFRAYFAVRPLSTRDGRPTHAVLGFAKMLQKLLKKEAPDYVGIAFDTKEKNFRHTLYPDYKANREAPPEDLTPQIPLIHELVEAMRLPPLLLPGYEADDVLATLTRKAVAQGFKVVVVTGDKDLMQLVDEQVILFDPLKDQFFDRCAVIEKFGVGPEHVGDVLGLAGDVSDNIPGVPKVGPKSAAKLVCAYGDVDAVIAGLKTKDKLSAYETSVLAHQDAARLSKKLATLAYDAPVELNLEHLTYGEPDHERLGNFLRSIEATGLLREFGLTGDLSKTQAASASTAISTSLSTQAPQQQKPQRAQPLASALIGDKNPLRPIDRSAYEMVTSRDQLEAIVSKAQATKVLSVDLETTSLTASQADIVGVALSIPDEVPAYVPIAHHYLGVPKQLRLDDVLAILGPILADPSIAKVGQNLKYDSIVFKRANIALEGITHDAMLAAYVLDASRMSFGLDALSKDFLKHEPITYDQITGTGRSRQSFTAVPVDTATQYAAEDSDVALRLCQLLVPKLEQDPQLRAIYYDIEMPLVPVLAQMEAAGVFIDTQALGALAKEFNQRLVALQDEAFAEIGEPINLGSPKQLSELFFNKLGYTPVKKTKTGLSTDQEVLETLARQHTLPRIILNHRLLTKLKSTYVDALPRMVNPATKRLHTSFNQTGTATGRLSSSDPNLQNIPIRHDDGRRIRSAFTSPSGYKLVSADYSQIELRIMAHLSEDEHFIDAFVQGEDIHERTAKEILSNGRPVTSEMRRSAKAINFGILYGLSEFGLARNLNISRSEARDYIAAYFGRYPRIRGFLEKTIQEGKERGYVETLLGRRRPLPNLRSSNGTVRQSAERIAMNTPIQGSAADLIKIAMIRVTKRLTKEQLKARLVLQVHDELVVEAPVSEVSQVSVLLQETMSQVWKLSVPLEVDVGTGDNWADAH